MEEVLKKMSRELLDEFQRDILDIEEAVFGSVGKWGIENFTSEYFNKFECSYLLLQHDKVIGYIVGHVRDGYGYVNRIAVLPDTGSKGLGKFLITCFEDNLKYNHCIDIVELVTHDSLFVDKFYEKLGYVAVLEENNIIDFLQRKEKIKDKKNYIGNDKYMKIFCKEL